MAFAGVGHQERFQVGANLQMEDQPQASNCAVPGLRETKDAMSDEDAQPEAIGFTGRVFGPEEASEQPPNAPAPSGALKKVSEWFTFENRCMVCGVKFARHDHIEHLRPHLDRHCEEGVLKKWGKFYEQVKAHPVGFPGILLPRELQWSR